MRKIYQLSTCDVEMEGEDMEMASNITLDKGSGGSSTQLILTAIQSSVLVAALLGNSITLCCLYWSHRKGNTLTRMSMFIVHLCLADISVAVFNVAPNLCVIASYPEACPFQMSHATCKATNYLSLVSIYGSTYVLVMTAIDRYIAINHPFRAQRLSNKHVHSMSAIAWTLAFVFSIPQTAIFKFDDEIQICFTEWHRDSRRHSIYERSYVIWFAVAVWMFPTLLIAASYINIAVVAWKRVALPGNHTVANRSKAMKPIQITIAVTAGYLICWSPWMLAMLILQFHPPPSTNSMYK